MAERCMVAICKDSNKLIAGVGFLVSANLILTCAHVVNTALGYEKRSQNRPEEPVPLLFHANVDDSLKSAEIVNWVPPSKERLHRTAKPCDIAVLKIDSAQIPQNASVAELVDDFELIGKNFRACGFPQTWSTGHWVDGKVAGYDFRHCFQLDCSGADANFIEKGFSGSPVIVDDSVVGMIFSARPDDKTAFMLPSSMLCERCEGLDIKLKSNLLKTYRHAEAVYDHANKALDKAEVSNIFDLRGKFFTQFSEIHTLWKEDNKDNYIENCFKPADCLSSGLTENPRIVIHAPGGYGKTTFLMSIVFEAIGRGMIPFFLDFTREKKVDFEERDPKTRISHLFEYFSVSGWFEDFEAQAKQVGIDNMILIADRLNESLHDPKFIIEAIKDLSIRKYPGLKIVLAERMRDHGLKTNFNYASILPLPNNEIAKHITDKDYLSDVRWLRLLSNPFFLNLHLKFEKKSDHEEKSLVLPATRISMLNRYFSEYGNLNEDQIQEFSEVAFRAYEIMKSTKIETEWWNNQLHNIGLLEQDINKFSTVGITFNSENAKIVEFRNQLLHDFLVGIYLANLKEIDWRSQTFDKATLRASSFDALEFAVEHLKEKADNFLNEMYDWNWQAVLGCILDLEASRSGEISPISNAFRDAVYALLTEKRFDHFEHTSMKIIPSISMFLSDSKINYAEMENLSQLIEEVDSKFNYKKADDLDYEEWKKVFLKNEPVESEDLSLLWSNPLISWTAANVFRRNTISQKVFEKLLDYFNVIYLTGELGDRAVGSRWRIVHILGRYPALENIEFLKSVLFNHYENHWVRFGAARSLIEAISLTPSREERKDNLAYVAKNIHLIKDETVLRELRLVAILNESVGFVEEWHEDYLPILRVGFEMYSSENRMEEAELWEIQIKRVGNLISHKK
jgi:Trypsin-like peptidase domain